MTVLPDPYDGDESRFRAICTDDENRYAFVVFCIRTVKEQLLIRPISARYMHRKEIDTNEKKTDKKPPVPTFKTDQEAEDFVADADLSQYDLSGGKTMQFEFENKSTQVNMRMPESLVTAVKAAAASRGIPYQRYIREVLERSLR